MLATILATAAQAELAPHVWAAAFERYGLPLMMLAGVAWGARSILQWLAPRGDRIVESHVGFIDHTKTVLDGINAEIDIQTRTLALIQERQVTIREAMERHHAALNQLTLDLAGAVKDNTQATLKVVERLDSVLHEMELERARK